jgi:hypothetical protein
MYIGEIRLHLQLKFAAAHLISFQTTTDQTHEAAAADGDAAVIGTMRSRRDYPRGETANLTLRNSGWNRLNRLSDEAAAVDGGEVEVREPGSFRLEVVPAALRTLVWTKTF